MKLNYQEIIDYNVAAPRYTSYPPANYFRDEVDVEKVLECVRVSNQTETKNLSFYFHIPFCPDRCLFCGCHTEIGVGGHEKQDYFNHIFSEINLIFKDLDKNRKVSQIHFGGGTPNAVPFKYLKQILDRIRAEFKFEDSCEVAIECDPALLSEKKIMELGEMGFNRISLGIQDVKVKVLKAVKREPSRLPLKELVSTCHKAGMKSVNLDLIYGLPYQTVKSFEETLELVIEAAPDRLATFAYAHIPWIKGQQNQLPVDEMPGAVERIRILEMAVSKMKEAGYSWIGMDHFAKKTDSLSVAQANGTLKRNFQGYCTREHTGQVYAFGASSISQLDNGFYQNFRDTKVYSEKLAKKELAFMRLYELTTKEKYVGAVIESIMCNGRVDFKEMTAKFPEQKPIEEEFEDSLASLVGRGLCEYDGCSLVLTEKGMWVSRYVAMHLDPLFHNREPSTEFSRAL